MKYCGEQPAPPKYLKDVVRKVTPFCFVDIRDIYQKHLTFSKSEDSLGLQLVDIAVTATRRVMNGNLQLRGWIGIARIMMESDRGGQVIQIIDLCGRQINYGHKKPPYWQVVPVAERARKELLLA